MKSMNYTIHMAPSSRLAFPLETRFLELMAPNGPGAYALYLGREPLYVGRSDQNVRGRLFRHPLRKFCTHFVAFHTGNARKAFILECLWYHRLVDRGRPLNQIHPARNRGNMEPCCICEIETHSAKQDRLNS
jgi:hypothetical protein